MAALQLAQNRGGAQMRDRLQHRHQFVTPALDEGILPRAVRSLKPARAAAAAWLYPSLRESMYRLTGWSVACLLGINVPPAIAGGTLRKVVSEPSHRTS